MSTKIGLKDVYYALLTTDSLVEAVYGTPARLAGAISANINPNPSIETLFADDGPMDTASTMGKIDLELNLADIALETQAILLGHAVADGSLYRSAQAAPPWVAIGFKSMKSDGTYRLYWLLKGKFSEPEIANETKGDSVNFQTPTISGSFIQRVFDANWIRETDGEVTGFVEALETGWFTSPDFEPV